MTSVFVYKKDYEYKFLTSEEAIVKHVELIGFGYTHISTINPAIILNRIHEILDEDYSTDEKINEIKNLITEQ